MRETAGSDASRAPKPLLSLLAPGMAIAAAVFLAHGAGLGNGFAWDDGVIIVDNPDTRMPERIGRVILSPDVRPPYYRPLNRASYLFDHMVFGMNPAGFHAVNLALQFGCALLLHALALRLSLGWAGALVASLLLAVHPVGVEVVGFVTARNNLFALLFSLASVLLFVDAERRNSAKRAALSAVALLLGLLGKEPAVMVLPLLGAILWLPELRSEPPAWRRLRLLAPHLLAIGAYLVLRTVSLGGLGGPAAATGALAGGWLHRLSLNYFAVPNYLVLLAFPRDLTIYHVLPEASPFTLLWAAAVWILLAAAVVALLRNRSAATTVGLLWFGLGLLPVSNLFSLPTATVIAERYIFIPAVGLWLVVGAFVDRLWRRRSLRLPTGIVAGVAIVALAFRSHARTLDWKDDLSLDRAAVAVEPRSATARLNLGSSLQGSGDLVGAWREWREAARLAPDDAGPWAAMGLQAQREGDRRLAAEFLLQALRLDPNQVASRVALGNLHDEAGDRERARAEWETALRIDPRHTGALVQLGTSWAVGGDLAQAERLLRAALAIDPLVPEALFNMGKLSDQLGRRADAIGFYNRFLAAPGADPAAARIAAERIRRLGAGGR